MKQNNNLFKYWVGLIFGLFLTLAGIAVFIISVASNTNTSLAFLFFRPVVFVAFLYISLAIALKNVIEIDIAHWQKKENEFQKFEREYLRDIL